MTERNSRITVAIVDDHTLFRVGLREIIEGQKDMEVVGEAGDAANALALVAQVKPDVLLLDVSIPGGDVTDNIHEVAEVSPDTRIVILSMQDDPELVLELIGLGIRGYLHKSASWDELIAAIRMATPGTDRVLLAVSRQSLLAMPAGTADKPAAGLLSPRELEVLGLVAKAMSNAQIAAEVMLTEATVKRHLHNIFVKLGAVSRIDAVNKATAASLIPNVG
ncbi:response regulator transcription factor [Nonomuraea sp. NPDC050786]|uniref:response regulator transcription factor n=1 Tax=Nonomuraea sp. NPDC050786 TaxID=3154840 RepID=UPI0033D8E741